MKRYRQAVSAIVLRPSSVCSPDGCSLLHSVLLVHKPRRGDAWQIPQGGIEDGETEVQAARRELSEETGLVLSGEAFVSTHTYTYDFPPQFLRRHQPVNAGQRLFFVVFEADKDVAVIVDDDEIDSYVWVLPEQISQYIKRKEYLEVIEDVLAEYEKAKKTS